MKAVNDSRILWVLLFALFLIYLVFKSTLVALAAAVVILIIVLLELWVGVRTGGLVGEVREIALAIILALVIWYGAGFLLNTGSPLDAVVSCSMLPALERGDMLVLQGGEVNAAAFNMTEAEWTTAESEGLLTQGCAICRNETSDHGCLTDRSLQEVEPDPLFNYGCSLCERYNETDRWFVGCATSVTVKNKTVKLGTGRRDTIVYAPLRQDPFARAGEIVHRAQIVVNVGDNEYIFTKGDNNNIFDVQAGNSPVTPDRVKGKVVMRIPYLGYFKLFISGLFSEPLGCNEEFTGKQEIKIDRD
ncbi:Uncharacterised protein [Candidatus Burarchaeum australiense]|nr:Uncharacterised protein [Candidatus Burarchaeum australiense]